MKRVCIKCYHKATLYQAPEVTLRFIALYPETIVEQEQKCDFHDSVDSEILCWIYDGLDSGELK